MWTYWWIPLVMAVPGFFLWIFLHELAHVVAVFATGGEVTGFRPYPHKTSDGWVFGEMGREGGNSTFMYLAPFIFDLLAYATLVPLVGVLEGWAWWLCASILVLPVIDTAVGILGRYRAVQKTDLRKVSWKWAVPAFALMLAYVVVTAGLVVWRLT